jgi:hypothetical protein
MSAKGVQAPMPRFFFHVRDALGYAEDDEGLELRGMAEARGAAVAGARSLLSAEVTAGELDLRGRIEVSDQDGKLVETIRFEDVVAVRTGELGSAEDRGGSE